MTIADPIAVAAIAAIAAILGSVVTLLVKRLEEKRLRAAASLERDLKSAELMVSLMQTANARGESRLVQEAAQVIADSARFKQTLAAVPPNPHGNTPEILELRRLLSSAITQDPVGQAGQLAAAQLVASLADANPNLREGALAGLRQVKVALPNVEVAYWEKRWAVSRWRARLRTLLRL